MGYNLIMPKKYITTPIYYVNDSPHIGHAYTTLVADILARYYKTKGNDVYLLTGTDEHGAKIQRAALNFGNQKSFSSRVRIEGKIKSQKSDKELIQEFTDKISQEFKDAWELLDINYDQFIRTTDPAHEKVVGEFLTTVKEAGYIYEGDYEGLYCVGCEEYKKEDELEDGSCPIHKKPVKKIKERVWFFKLSAFQDQILELIESGKSKILPETRKNEVVSFLKSGLEDIAISRSKVEWGIPLPWDKTQTVYVWVDALINYYSAPVIAGKDIFPPDVQFMAKDILRFHAVIFPALLLSIGLVPTKQIVSHGFFTINGHKMSKSLGNTIAPKELVDTFGVDGARYLLLSQFPFGSDGDFSLEKLEVSYNAQLANNLGNLVQRVLVMIQKNDINITPTQNPPRDPGADTLIEQFQFDRALDEIFKLVQNANIQIDREKPWEFQDKISKSKNQNDREKIKNELDKILTSLFRQLETIAVSLTPFMPTTAQKILDQLKSGNPEPLFPKIIS